MKDRCRVVPVLRLDIPRGDNAQLLVRFVELAFGDSGGVSAGFVYDAHVALLLLLSLYRLF
jgi:hypothetical protein